MAEQHTAEWPERFQPVDTNSLTTVGDGHGFTVKKSLLDRVGLLDEDGELVDDDLEATPEYAIYPDRVEVTYTLPRE